ncbi:hypothetical protein Tco_1408467 [Tanacetum coccineum]
MNYKLVVAGNQSNGNASTKACDNVGKARMEAVPGKDYILLPLWTQDPPFSSSSKDSPDAGFKPSGEEEKKDAEDPGNEGDNPSEEGERINQEKDASDIKSAFLYEKIEKDVYVCQPLGFEDPDFPDRESPFDLVAYTDSDYAGASLDRKSTTGGCQFLGCRLISWHCKKQIVVANSTTKAEYIAASNYLRTDKAHEIRSSPLIIIPNDKKAYSDDKDSHRSECCRYCAHKSKLMVSNYAYLMAIFGMLNL